jgi:hypothetical protein
VLFHSAAASAAIYVIGDDSLGYADNAVSRLQAVGYTVQQGASLSDYSAYEQVWDLRYSAVSTPTWTTDITALSSYLSNGGRLLITGERSNLTNYAARNAQVVSFLDATLHAGKLVVDETFSPPSVVSQNVTAAGGNVTDFSQIDLYGGSSVRFDGPSPGFLISESQAKAGSGTFVGWDFGSLPTAPDSRLIAGFDVNVFRPNYGSWNQDDSEQLTREFAEFLGAVPEPASLVLWGLGAAGISFAARRRRQPAA